MNNNTGAKFKSCKTPRYLPGSVHKAILQSDLKEYNKHLYKVFNATPKVDCTPPKFHSGQYMGTHNLVTAVYALKEIERGNKKLLQKINTINRTQGKVNTFNEYANSNSSKWHMKELEFERINKENKKIYKQIFNTKPAYPKSEQDEHWKLMIKKMHYFSKFPLVILRNQTQDDKLKECPSISKDLEINETPIRPKCFLQFKIDNGIILGKVMIELYSDQTPKTVEHFLNLCRGENNMSLKNCSVFKIIESKYCLAGNTTNYNGKGNTFEQENFNLKHTRPGVISMVPIEEDKVNSQFCITFRKMSDLDSKNVVFGKIIRGARILFKVSEFGTWHGKPITKIIISDCGEIEYKPTEKNLLRNRQVTGK